MKKQLLIKAFLFYKFIFILLSLSALSPMSSMLDGFLDIKPVSYDLKYANGDQGVEDIITNFLTDSDRLDKILIKPLEKNGIDLFFSKLNYPGESGSYLAIDIFPKEMQLKRDFYIKNMSKSQTYDNKSSIIQVPELSVGRITISFSKKNGVVIPIIWEIQPSPFWRTTEEKESFLINNWRKDVTRALSRFFINEGFSDIYARSETSIKNHVKYSSTSGNQKTKTEVEYGQFIDIKNVISPRDARDYRKTFSNRDLWQEANALTYNIYSEKLGKFSTKEELLHKYTKPDVALQNKGIKNYKFEEVIGRKGSKLIVVFENQVRNLKYSVLLHLL